MNKQKYNDILSKDKLTTTDKVNVLNYYLKNEAPKAIADDRVWLSDCKVKEPISKRGLYLLDYSIARIKEMSNGIR